MKHEVKNRAQGINSKNDQKNKQDVATAPYAQRPNAQQNEPYFPQGQRFIRSWVEGKPEDK